MNEFKRILLPTDFSPGADQALRHAVALAGRSEATLHVLHVVERDRDAVLEFPLMEELIDSVHQAIARIDSELMKDDVDDQARVRLAVRAHHEAARCILEYAGDYAIDLIVISPMGHRRSRSQGLGTTAEKVARLASCDVLTTGRHLTPGPDAARRILVPVDFSTESRLAIERARRIAAESAGHLTLLHVQQRPIFPAASRQGAAIGLLGDRTRTEKDLARFYGRSRGPDVPHSFRVERGNPAGRIAAFAESHDIQLIVQSSRGLPGIDYAMLGSIAERVVRHATCSVLIVKESSTERAVRHKVRQETAADAGRQNRPVAATPA